MDFFTKSTVWIVGAVIFVLFGLGIYFRRFFKCLLGGMASGTVMGAYIGYGLEKQARKEKQDARESKKAKKTEDQSPVSEEKEPDTQRDKISWV